MTNPLITKSQCRKGAKGQPLKPRYYAPRLSSVLGVVKDATL